MTPVWEARKRDLEKRLGERPLPGALPSGAADAWAVSSAACTHSSPALSATHKGIFETAPVPTETGPEGGPPKKSYPRRPRSSECAWHIFFEHPFKSECLHRKADRGALRGGTARRGVRSGRAAAAWLAPGPGSPLTGRVTSEGHLSLPASGSTSLCLVRPV